MSGINSRNQKMEQQVNPTLQFGRSFLDFTKPIIFDNVISEIWISLNVSFISIVFDNLHKVDTLNQRSYIITKPIYTYDSEIYEQFNGYLY